MPKRLIAIGLLFVIFGLMAIANVISGLAHNRINLNFGVLLLPVGIGLLSGKKSSQWWAGFWLIFGCAVSGILILVALATPQNVNATWFGKRLHGPSAVPTVILFSVGFSAGFLFLHRLLYSEKAVAYFNRNV